jgi:hypothetical protein
MKRNLLNLALFQVAWFAAVLGAANGATWLGPLVMLAVLGVHLATTQDRQGELKLLGVAGLAGFLFDTSLVAAGVLTPVQALLPHPFSPPWMIGLWLNFAATLNVSLAWLQERYLLAALCGAVGGPLAYYGGAKLGATASLPTTGGIFILAFGWGILTPLLVRAAKSFRS